jgi:hypothetical protein
MIENGVRPEGDGNRPNPGGSAMRRSIALTAAAWAAVIGSAARAEHAKISLEVVTPKEHKTAFVDQTPPDWGKNPRPVLKAKVNDPIKVQWSFTNVYPHKTLANVVVHFYVAREEKAGQKETPDLRGEVVAESAFEMDFKPGAKAGQRQSFRIDAPGAYLIRVESRQTQSDHEHFAAIDLVVEAEKP